jgi:predicted transcriptional regulator
LHRLGFPDLPLLLKALTPARWDLVARLREKGPLSVRALAKTLQRDYKNVHTDVAQLTQLGLIERTGDSLVRVPWDAVRAELRL